MHRKYCINGSSSLPLPCFIALKEHISHMLTFLKSVYVLQLVLTWLRVKGIWCSPKCPHSEVAFFGGTTHDWTSIYILISNCDLKCQQEDDVMIAIQANDRDTKQVRERVEGSTFSLRGSIASGREYRRWIQKVVLVDHGGAVWPWGTYFLPCGSSIKWGW